MIPPNECRVITGESFPSALEAEPAPFQLHPASNPHDARSTRTLRVIPLRARELDRARGLRFDLDRGSVGRAAVERDAVLDRTANDLVEASSDRGWGVRADDGERVDQCGSWIRPCRPIRDAELMHRVCRPASRDGGCAVLTLGRPATPGQERGQQDAYRDASPHTTQTVQGLGKFHQPRHASAQTSRCYWGVAVYSACVEPPLTVRRLATDTWRSGWASQIRTHPPKPPNPFLP